MRPILAAALAAALAGTAATGQVHAPAPVDRGRPVIADAVDMVKAIVVLKSQVDPGTVKAPSRRQRQSALVRALRARAASDQVRLLELLNTRRRAGLVAEIAPLWVVNAVAVVARPSVIRELAERPEVREISPDRTVQAPSPGQPSSMADGPAAEPNVEAVNAPALWSLGLTGKGVVVATMDTGVDASHPDLAGSWRGGSNSWYDPNGEHPAVPTDISGHGTSTMGVIVGGSAGGSAIGVAPGAKWIAVKIFNDRGVATTSRIHQGFQWLLDPDGDPATADAPDVVNNSWSGAAGGCNLDFQPDLRNLRAAGILPVFSAGNYGPATSTVLSPANNPEAFAVGSVDDAGAVDPSSSRGPSACGQQIAPRLVAPGVGVRTTDLYGGYLDASGTSLAAPHVAGALALLLEAFPNLSADRQQAALESAAVDLGSAGPDNTYGYGRLDALAAYQFLSAAPDLTVAASPTEATTAAGGAVSYTVSVAGVNGFAGDVTLALSGLTPSQGSWTISPALIAGGAGTAQVTVTTAPALAAGAYPLMVTATSGTLSRTTAMRLVVTAAPDFALTASPVSVFVLQRQTAVYTVSTAAIGGFVDPVALSVTGAPARSSVSFAPNPVSVPGSSLLRVTTTALTPRGTFTLRITGTSGFRAHDATVTLMVR